MTVQGINCVCVVGAGTMGQQIALSFALAGYKTTCTDVIADVLERADKFADTYLQGRVAKGKLTETAAKQARDNISFALSLEQAASNADFVVEAVLEKLELKQELFAKLDKLCPPHAILATNSSFIVSSKIAPVTARPDLVCNMHFFAPVLAMKLVEVVQGPHTSDATANTAVEVARSMEKVPVLLKKEIYGFLVNRILTAINLEALYLHDTGIASAEDIDIAVVNALGHPMGPFKLMDLSGIDVIYQVLMERYKETGNPSDKPSPAIVEKYVKGEWGQKRGKGFYDYSGASK